MTRSCGISDLGRMDILDTYSVRPYVRVYADELLFKQQMVHIKCEYGVQYLKWICVRWD